MKQRPMIRRVGALALLAACRVTPTPSEPHPPQPPATDRDDVGTPLGDACARLRELGCPEGSPTKAGKTCVEHLQGVAELAEVPAACIAAASSREAVRACGDENTTRIRCAE